MNNEPFWGHVASSENDEFIYHANMSVLVQIKNATLKIIADTQPRTQFITYINSSLHAFLFDVSWNKLEQCVDIICIDSLNNDFMFSFCDNFEQYLRQTNNDARFIICKTNLQKDSESCGLYSIKFAKLSARLQFDDLWEKSRAHSNTEVNKPEVPRNVKIISVTDLGLKAVSLGQSLSEMKTNVAALYPSPRLKPNVF